MTVSADKSELDGSGPSDEPDKLPTLWRIKIDANIYCGREVNVFDCFSLPELFGPNDLSAESGRRCFLRRIRCILDAN